MMFVTCTHISFLHITTTTKPSHTHTHNHTTQPQQAKMQQEPAPSQHHHAAAAAAALNPSPPPPPSPPSSSFIIFQCASCRRILGDSLALTSADEDLRHITLRGACGIVRGPCAQTSQDGKDLGSTFHELFCEGCNALLGKVYLTTAPHMDAARNLFTLSTEALESYELGSYDHTCELPPGMVVTGAAAAAGGEDAAAAAAAGGAPPQAVQMELTKLQNMMLVFHDRISTLERAWKGMVGSSSSRRSSGENVPAAANSHKRKKK